MEQVYRKIISKNNLTLAWRRILTGSNTQYKKFFRSLYYAYEIAHEENIDYLHKKLSGNWKPGKPISLHIPKSSGLQRGITLLPIEDQIVLQSIANIFADKIYERRKKVENKVVFSNILTKPKDSIFFIEDWKKSYRDFRGASEFYFKKGNKWVVDFDLAAFYDTVSHSLLLNVLWPRSGQVETCEKIKEWLKYWSSSDHSLLYDHGIPQGPIASNLLAEAFLLDLDELMKKNNIPYLRYVDDIKIFASSEAEAFKAIINLDKYCKKRGIIPQSKKLSVKKISTIEDVFTGVKSLSGDHSYILEDDNYRVLKQKESEDLMRSSMEGKPLMVTNKTKFKYTIYRSPKSKKILQWINLLLPRHPEYIDAFSSYLYKFGNSKIIEKTIIDVLKNARIPYDYTRGELWRIMSKIGSKKTLLELLNEARNDAECKSNCPMLRWGALMFLLECEKESLINIKRLILKQGALVQALLSIHISDSEYSKKGLIKKLLISKDYEPGIMLANELIKRKKTHRDFDIKIKEMPMQVQNIFRALFIIKKRREVSIDSIGDILCSRYGIKNSHIWKAILGPEYIHALQILLQSDKLYQTAPSMWLQQQDSFNDILVRCLANFFSIRSMPTQVTHEPKGYLIDMGVLLNSTQVLYKNYTAIFHGLSLVHKRRNNLPSSHPYDKKTGVKTAFLKSRGRDKLRNDLKISYSEIINLIEGCI